MYQKFFISFQTNKNTMINKIIKKQVPNIHETYNNNYKTIIIQFLKNQNQVIKNIFYTSTNFNIKFTENQYQGYKIKNKIIYEPTNKQLYKYLQTKYTNITINNNTTRNLSHIPIKNLQTFLKNTYKSNLRYKIKEFIFKIFNNALPFLNECPLCKNKFTAIHLITKKCQQIKQLLQIETEKH